MGLDCLMPASRTFPRVLSITLLKLLLNYNHVSKCFVLQPSLMSRVSAIALYYEMYFKDIHNC